MANISSINGNPIVVENYENDSIDGATKLIDGTVPDSKLVQSGGVLENLDKLEGVIGRYGIFEHAGYMININSYEGQSSYHCYRTWIIPVSEGDVFWFLGAATFGIFYTLNGEYVSRHSYNCIYVPGKVVVPSGVDGVIFTSLSAIGSTPVFALWKEDGDAWNQYLSNSDVEWIGSNYTIKQYPGYVSSFSNSNQKINYDGTSNYYSLTSDPIKCSEGDKFYYKGTGASKSVLYFDDSSTLLSSENINDTEHFTEVTCPEGAEFVTFTSFANSVSGLVLELYKKGSYKDGFERLPQYGAEIAESSRRLETNPPLATHIVDGYLNQNGTYSDTAGMKSRVTDKIKCSAGDRFYYYGICSSGVVACMWFNANDEIIGYEKPSHGDYAQVEFVAPENSAKALFTSYIGKQYADPSLIVIMNKDTYNSPLTWKTWYPCGDSFTFGDFAGIDDYRFTSGRYVGYNKTYPYHIGNRTNINVKRASVSGETMAAYSGGTVVFSDENYAYGYKSVANDADYVTLWFGINDSGHSIPIGTIDDDDNTTFYGAWNVVLDDLTTRCTKAHIGIIVSNNLSASYVDAVIAVAKKWGIPYLDLNYDNNIPLMHCSLRPDASDAIKEKRNAQFAINYGTNNHPNLLAHEYESYFIEEWLKTL